jgi:hypothetical protein
MEQSNVAHTKKTTPCQQHLKQALQQHVYAAERDE